MSGFYITGRLGRPSGVAVQVVLRAPTGHLLSARGVVAREPSPDPRAVRLESLDPDSLGR
jgi:hypothetical protein